jgi:hypothetical protein
VFTLDKPLRLLSKTDERKKEKYCVCEEGKSKFVNQFRKGLFMEAFVVGWAVSR